MTVKLYSTPTCPYCSMVRKFLQDNNIVFEDIDIAESREAAHEMLRKPGQLGVPVLDVNGTIIVGFDMEAIKNALKF